MQYNNSKGQITAQVSLGKNVKSGFNMDNVTFGTGRIGRLYPVSCDHVYPDDTYDRKSTVVMQFKPLAVPLMTDMHIKQENFYVPFNTVWKNFDNFISNGERNDFNRPVPCLSLSEMLEKFIAILNNNDGRHRFPFESGYGLPLVVSDYREYEGNGDSIPVRSWAKGNYGSKFISFDYFLNVVIGGVDLGHPASYFLENFDFASSPLGSILQTYQMYDLFDYVVPLYKRIQEILRDAIKYSNDTPLILPAPSQENPVLANSCVAMFRDIRTYGVPSLKYIDEINYDKPSKYFERIANSLQKCFDDLNMYAIVPTNTCESVIRCLYDIYKALFGVGSNLDMLGYNMLKYEDFLYLCILRVAKVISSSSSQDTTGKYSINTMTTNYAFDLYPNSSYASTKKSSMLPLRALYSIWFNNYRDQLIEDKAYSMEDIIDNDSTSNIESLVMLSPRLRCWHKDSFTTALDNAGTGSAIVPTLGSISGQDLSLKTHQVFAKALGTDITNENNAMGLDIAEVKIGNETFRLPTPYLRGVNPLTGEVLTDTDYFSLEMLDAAQRAQKWIQKSLFYGNRIQDFLFTHFGVKFLDQRLRLPELLSVSSDMVQMQQIVANNTIVTEKSTNIAGDKAGFAYGKNESTGIHHYIPEHGVVISMLSVVPDVVYSNAYDRHLSYIEQLDYPFEEFATLGLQAVYENEMMRVPTKVYDEERDFFGDEPCVHGFQGMYYADKSKFSTVHGELLEEDNVYVMDREFSPYSGSTRPKLNYIFVHCHPKLDAFVVDNEWSDYFRFDVYHNHTVDRLLPVHSVYI